MKSRRDEVYLTSVCVCAVAHNLIHIAQIRIRWHRYRTYRHRHSPTPACCLLLPPTTIYSINSPHCPDILSKITYHAEAEATTATGTAKQAAGGSCSQRFGRTNLPVGGRSAVARNQCSLIYYCCLTLSNHDRFRSATSRNFKRLG
jgi:hypothetical protein